MKRLDKERRKLEKVGFSGQTLERAMELLERTNAPLLGKLLVKICLLYTSDAADD